jgi:hypothetical protein
MSRQLGLLLALSVPGHGDDQVELLGLDRPPWAPFKGIPVPVRAGDRVVPDQEEQISHRLLQRVRIPCRRLDLVDEISAQPTMDVGVGVGIAPA